MPEKAPLSLTPKKKLAPPEARSRRPWAAVLIVVILAGAASWFWIAKDPARQDAVVNTAKEAVTVLNTAKDAVVSAANKAGELIRGDKTPRNEGQPGDAQHGSQGAQGGSATGHTAGNAGQSNSGQNTDSSAAQSASGPEAEGKTTRGLVGSDPNQTPPDLAKRDDAVVRIAFIDDLARWMVASYTPATNKGGRGSIAIGVQSANARYGVGMKGLAWIGDDLPAGRAEALRYVYTPGMLDALYRMYIGRFMQAMADAADEVRKDGKEFDPAQLSEMYRLYAGRFRALSGAVQGVAAITDLRERVSRIHAAAQTMVEANSRYVEDVFKYDRAREGNDQAAIEKMRAAMETASDAYQQATHERDRLREALIGTIRNNPDARAFGDDNLWFVALWIDRRLQQSPQALEASAQAATLFLDLAQRFEQVVGVRP